MSESMDEKKRKRLEAWRRKQQQQAIEKATAPEAPRVALSLSLSSVRSKPKTKARAKPPSAAADPFFFDADDEDSGDDQGRPMRPLLDLDEEQNESAAAGPSKKRRKGPRWDNKDSTTDASKSNAPDALEEFMTQLQSGTADIVKTQELNINVSGSMMTMAGNSSANSSSSAVAAIHRSVPQYQPSDWMSDTGSNTDDEQEELARRKLIEALASAPVPPATSTASTTETEGDQMMKETNQPIQLAADVKSEKLRREQQLKQLEQEALSVRATAEQAADVGRLYNEEGDVMEEAERILQVLQQAPDALTVLAELNKKKEIQAVEHTKIDYHPIIKNLYRVPRSLASLTHDDIVNRRAKLQVKVRGQGTPAPVSAFEECGLPDRILQILQQQNIRQPFPIQAQSIPCIMAGRDVIGIAKTGSGKTYAYLLGVIRHIMAQPPLGPNESGPVALILCPARELAFQIFSVCRPLAKPLGLKATAVYGGAGVAEQISDLKRGAHIVVATPGRLIDILTMQAGKLLSLQRVTFVVMDEADRMYDMGFAPQITAILSAVRPDRQTVLFSATFPKAIESLARKSLKYPVEIIVGGRSIASNQVTQYAELVEEDEKFLRLLQLLGEQVEGTKKVIVFVDTQVRADNLFEQLLRNGYPALSLHGGKEQEDRDTTISDFKRKDGPNVLVATGVAGRGLDVPACTCVINYSSPNHLEALIHQVGRCGRAEMKGVAYTFVNPADEAKYAPIVVRALSEAGQGENIEPELKKLAEDFKAKVDKGEAKYAGNGFKGKGYTYDSNELSDAQKVARYEKRQALIEAGMLDPDDDDQLFEEQLSNKPKADERMADLNKASSASQMEIPDHLTPELLALPGMKEALLRKAGIIAPSEQNTAAINPSIGDNNLDPSLGRPVKMGESHWLQEVDINDYPREARWKVTQRETTGKLQDEFRTAVTLKGSYFPVGKVPSDGERRLYLHLESTSERNLQNCVLEIHRLLNEETLRVGVKGVNGGGHKYNVL